MYECTLKFLNFFKVFLIFLCALISVVLLQNGKKLLLVQNLL